MPKTFRHASPTISVSADDAHLKFSKLLQLCRKRLFYYYWTPYTPLSSPFGALDESNETDLEDHEVDSPERPLYIYFTLFYPDL